MPTERYHPRVEANFMVKVDLGGRAVLAKARDLSMAGLCLIGNPGVTSGDVTVRLPLPNEGEVAARCRVKRATPDSVALEFVGLDWDDMLMLARFLHPRLP